MSTSRSLDVLEGDRSRECQSYRQLRNLECREETSGSGPIDYHNQFRNLQLRSPYQSRQRDNWRNQVWLLKNSFPGISATKFDRKLLNSSPPSTMKFAEITT